MSSSGTAQWIARARSGRWVIAAPISSPPFEPPRSARRSWDVRSRSTSQSRRGVEVVEHLLLVLAHAGAVPVLAFLGAAADAGVGEQAARLGDRDGDRRVRRSRRDGEAAVAGEQARRRRRRCEVATADEEHRHVDTVGRRVADLLDVKGVGSTGDEDVPHARRPARRSTVQDEGRANDSSCRNARGLRSSSVSKPASETGPGSSIVALVGAVERVRPQHRRRRASCRARAADRPRPVRRRASMTMSLSGTSVTHASCVGAVTGAAKTRPRGASRVVTPISRSSTTRANVCASTPSIRASCANRSLGR